MRDTPGLIERFEFIAADGGRVERARPPAFEGNTCVGSRYNVPAAMQAGDMLPSIGPGQ